MIEEEVPEAVGSVYGHNSGSMRETAEAEQAAALHDTVRAGGKTFAQRRAEFLASAAAQTVRDRQSAAAAGDTIKLAGEVWALIDADRRERSDPYRETHLSLSGMASGFWSEVNDAMEALRGQIDTWTAEEDKRIAARQREQEEEMARWRAPAAPAPIAAPSPPAARAHIDYTAPTPPPTPAMAAMRPAKRSKIRGDLGATISARDVVSYEIEDISLIPDHIMQSPVVRDAILDVVRRTARVMGVPAGIRVITNTGNQIR